MQYYSFVQYFFMIRLYLTLLNILFRSETAYKSPQIFTKITLYITFHYFNLHFSVVIIFDALLFVCFDMDNY